MTDAQLEAKFQGLSDPVLSAGRTRERINACWSVGNAAHVKALVALAVHHLPLQGAALVTALKDADAAVMVRDCTPLDGAVLAQLPKLRCLVFTGSRNSTIDLAAFEARGIPVSHNEWVRGCKSSQPTGIWRRNRHPTKRSISASTGGRRKAFVNRDGREFHR